METGRGGRLCMERGRRGRLMETGRGRFSMENRRREAVKMSAENLNLWYGEKQALREISLEVRKAPADAGNPLFCAASTV